MPDRAVCGDDAVVVGGVGADGLGIDADDLVGLDAADVVDAADEIRNADADLNEITRIGFFPAGLPEARETTEGGAAVGLLGRWVG